jgi:hyperosmotically inducible protein
MMKPLIVLALAAALAACGEPESPAKTSAAKPPENTAIPPQGVTESKDTAAAPAESPAPQASASSASGSDGAPATDNEMSSKIKQELAANGNVPADGIEVAAADGVVTLTGSVNQAEEKERAALFVIGLDGVRSVVNNLTVRGS